MAAPQAAAGKAGLEQAAYEGPVGTGGLGQDSRSAAWGYSSLAVLRAALGAAWAATRLGRLGSGPRRGEKAVILPFTLMGHRPPEEGGDGSPDSSDAGRPGGGVPGGPWKAQALRSGRRQMAHSRWRQETRGRQSSSLKRNLSDSSHSEGDRSQRRPAALSHLRDSKEL